MNRNLVFLFLIIIPFHPQQFGQDKAKCNDVYFNDGRLNNLSPLIYGKKNDGLPDKMKLSGVITETSYAAFHCGIIYSAGTLKIKLLEKINGYPYDDVFVVIGCFLDPCHEDKYLNKNVDMQVFKLYEDYNRRSKRNPCYFEHITNTIKSNGTPFYCSKMDQEDILDNIKRKDKKGGA